MPLRKDLTTKEMLERRSYQHWEAIQILEIKYKEAELDRCYKTLGYIKEQLKQYEVS